MTNDPSKNPFLMEETEEHRRIIAHHLFHRLCDGRGYVRHPHAVERGDLGDGRKPRKQLAAVNLGWYTPMLAVKTRPLDFCRNDIRILFSSSRV